MKTWSEKNKHRYRTFQAFVKYLTIETQTEKSFFLNSANF